MEKNIYTSFSTNAYMTLSNCVRERGALRNSCQKEIRRDEIMKFPSWRNSGGYCPSRWIVRTCVQACIRLNKEVSVRGGVSPGVRGRSVRPLTPPPSINCVSFSFRSLPSSIWDTLTVCERESGRITPFFHCYMLSSIFIRRRSGGARVWRGVKISSGGPR